MSHKNYFKNFAQSRQSSRSKVQKFYEKNKEACREASKVKMKKCYDKNREACREAARVKRKKCLMKICTPVGKLVRICCTVIGNSPTSNFAVSDIKTFLTLAYFHWVVLTGSVEELLFPCFFLTTFLL